MWTLGKTAALAASVRIATSQQGRARLLQARIDLAREIHERVVQRLFGVSLVLGSEHGAERGGAPPLRGRDAGRARGPARRARRGRSPRRRLDTGATLRGELARLGRHYKDLPLELDWEEGVEVPEEVEPLAQSVLAEALRNARQARAAQLGAGARRAHRRHLRARGAQRRRAAAPRAAGTGMGLRLAAVEALQRGALVEFGPRGPGLAGAARGAAGGRFRGMSPERNLRVLVVDDHDVVHWGFRLLLTEQPWVERCLTASSVEEALEMARRYEPHVALVDLFLGEESGAELCEAIRRESPNTRVLLISGAGWISPQAAKAAGASGFVSKDWPAHDVAMAVRMVGQGHDRVRAARGAALHAAVGARARGADAHGVRRRPTRRSPSACSSHRTR